MKKKFRLFLIIVAGTSLLTFLGVMLYKNEIICSCSPEVIKYIQKTREEKGIFIDVDCCKDTTIANLIEKVRK